MIAFGPIESRRFGRSLGVNNIPSKHCSYSCVYCQVGATPHLERDRREFYSPDEIVAAVEEKVALCRERGERIDFISFVPDGEPTLDLNLGESLRRLQRIGIPLAVITNGSLLFDRQLRHELRAADVVSIEVDTVDERVWKRLDRPAPSLNLPQILGGMLEFASAARSSLWTQTMITAGINDDEAGLLRLATFLGQLAPKRAWLAAPTRPPADARVTAPDEETLVRAYAILASKVPHLEVLRSLADDHFVRTGEPIADLLATLTVHPLREDAIARELDAEAIEDLIAQGTLMRVEYGGSRFLALNRGLRTQC